MKGDIYEIEVQGLIYKTPPAPAPGDIRKLSKHKFLQFWERDLTYEQWTWTEKYIEKGVEKERLISPDRWSKDQMAWYEEEIHRLTHGTWIKLNGVETYFNKYCYFFLQWFKLLDGSYPMYKDVCLEYFYFFELCERDRFCFGDLGIKGRRVGLSSMSAAIKVLIAITEENTLSGIVSKTGLDAQEMYFMVKNGIEGLPLFLQPDIADVNESQIKIGKSSQKITASNKQLNSDKGLNNRVNWLNTSETAYDGRAMRHVTCDEAGKWQKNNVLMWFRKIGDALKKGTSIIGKVSVFSTVSRGDMGGDNFRVLWDGSDHMGNTTDKYGRTQTQLKRFFLPAYKGYMGYIGRYGESIIEDPTPEQVAWLKRYEYYNPLSKQMEKCPDPTIGAKQWLQATRDRLAGDEEALAEEMRNNPFTWQEVFKGANNLCHFKIDQINDQLELLRYKLEGTGKKENGRRMSFRMGDNGRAYPVDDPTGYWYIMELIEHNNKHVYRNGIKCPDNVLYGAAGLDSYHNERNAVEKGSNACVMIMSRYNPLKDDNDSNRIVAMFYGRPDSKIEFQMQIEYALQYYGVKMLGERSPTDWIDRFKEHKLASSDEIPEPYGYLISTKRWDDSGVYGITPAKAPETHLTAMKEYALNNMHKIPFIGLLEEMIKFDVKNRTDYDRCMAFGYALMALNESVKIDAKPEPSKLRILPIAS